MEDNASSIQFLTWNPLTSFLQRHLAADSYWARTLELEERRALVELDAGLARDRAESARLGSEIATLGAALLDMKLRIKVGGAQPSDAYDRETLIGKLEAAERRRVAVDVSARRAEARRPRVLKTIEAYVTASKTGEAPGLSVEDALERSENASRLLGAVAERADERAEVRVAREELRVAVTETMDEVAEATAVDDVDVVDSVDPARERRLAELRRQYGEEASTRATTSTMTTSTRAPPTHIFG